MGWSQLLVQGWIGAQVVLSSLKTIEKASQPSSKIPGEAVDTNHSQYSIAEALQKALALENATAVLSSIGENVDTVYDLSLTAYRSPRPLHIQLDVLHYSESFSYDLEANHSRALAVPHFAKLQKMWKMEPPQFPLVSMTSNSKGAARVGGLFYWSADARYLLKTIKEDEVPQLMKILPQYIAHMEKNPDSLLTRIYGVYQIPIGGRLRTFLVMEASLPSRCVRYDLKGSTLGRTGTSILKDLDLLGDDENTLCIQDRSRILAQLEQDVQFLTECNVIDYSLLVGIQKGRRRTGLPGCVFGKRKRKKVTFHLGLIDFLQPFNAKKMVEYQAKTVRYRNEAYSCVPPRQYGERFLKFNRKRLVDC